MSEVQVRVDRTIFVQPEVFVRRREAFQKVRRDQLVKFCEPRLEERVLVPCDDCRLPEVATDIIVRDSTKQHGSLYKQQERVCVSWGVIDEYVRLGYVLRISRRGCSL